MSESVIFAYYSRCLEDGYIWICDVSILVNERLYFMHFTRSGELFRRIGVHRAALYPVRMGLLSLAFLDSAGTKSSIVHS